MTEPPRIARLPHDRRGYPIPWNALRDADGFPFFTVNNDSSHYRALREELCPICGERLGRWKWFVGGPRSAFDVNGGYLDLPGHHDCVRYALATCPYLASPRYLRHLESVPHADRLPPEARVLIDETVIPERPTVFVAVASNGMTIYVDPPLLPRVRPLRPHYAYEFWLHGREIPAHEAMPLLRETLGQDWELPLCAS